MKTKRPLSYFDKTDIGAGKELISPHGMNTIQEKMQAFGEDFAAEFLRFLVSRGADTFMVSSSDVDMKYWMERFKTE